VLLSSYNAAVFPVLSASEYNVSFIQYESETRKNLEISANSTGARQGLAGSLQNTTTWSETHKGPYSSASGDLFLIYDQVAFLTNSAIDQTIAFHGNASLTLESSQFWESLNMSTFWSNNPNNLGTSKSDWISSSDNSNPSSVHIACIYCKATS
jgi:hypothetical protein